MKNNENLNRQPHWRCRLCGHSTPLEQAVCSNPSCRADLGIYGEAVTPGQEDDGRRAWKQREEESRQQREYDQRQAEEAQAEEQRRKEEAQQRKDEARRQKAEEQRRRAEEKARAKAARQAGRSGSGAPKWLVRALAAVLVAVLGIGAGAFFSGRSTAGNPVPPQNSAGPGPGSGQTEAPVAPKSDPPVPEENQPGQEESPSSAPQMGRVLMSDCLSTSYNDGNGKEQPAFGGQFKRREFRSITFMDSLDDMHGTQWDVSQDQDGSVMAWAELNSETGLYDLYIGAEGGVKAPLTCSEMFSDYVNVERISFNGAFHTEHTAFMDNMFSLCGSLREVDISSLDTSGASDMAAMFSDCSSLTQLDASGFNTSGVADMRFMFYRCSSLARLDVSSFDTSHVLNMYAMFSQCSGLTGLDVSGFDTSRVTDMGFMFNECQALQALNLSGFNTSSVTDMQGMFQCCESLTGLDVSGFDTSNVTDMSWMFYGCSGLSRLNITGFKTSKVTTMQCMFAAMDSGFALDYSPENFDTSNVENYEGFMADSFDWEKMFQ